MKLTLTIFFRKDVTNSHEKNRGTFFCAISALRTKMWIARAVMIGSLRFWVIWRAESILLHLSTTFMGLGATPLPPSPKTCGLDFLKTGRREKNKISEFKTPQKIKSRFSKPGSAEKIFFSGHLVLSPNTKEYMELTLLVVWRSASAAEKTDWAVSLSGDAGV